MIGRVSGHRWVWITVAGVPVSIQEAVIPADLRINSATLHTHACDRPRNTLILGMLLFTDFFIGLPRCFLFCSPPRGAFAGGANIEL